MKKTKFFNKINYRINKKKYNHKRLDKQLYNIDCGKYIKNRNFSEKVLKNVK